MPFQKLWLISPECATISWMIVSVSSLCSQSDCTLGMGCTKLCNTFFIVELLGLRLTPKFSTRGSGYLRLLCESIYRTIFHTQLCLCQISRFHTLTGQILLVVIIMWGLIDPNGKCLSKNYYTLNLTIAWLLVTVASLCSQSNCSLGMGCTKLCNTFF